MKISEEEGGGGEDIKDCRFSVPLTGYRNTFTASHYIMSKIVNKQITTVYQRPQSESRTKCSGGVSSRRGKKHHCSFKYYCMYTCIFSCSENWVARTFLWTSLSGLTKYLWRMSFTGCRAAISVIYDKHPIMAHHSLNGVQQFTSESWPVPFFSQIEAMSPLNAQWGCY